MTTYLIGEVARLTGLRSKTIRYYEEIALIPPANRSNPSHASPGYRVYSDPDVKRLRLIKSAKLLDFSLVQLKKLVEAADEGCCEMLEPKLHSFLESKLWETEAKLRDLAELRDTLRTLTSQGTAPSKPSIEASDCFTTDCGFSLPFETPAK